MTAHAFNHLLRGRSCAVIIEPVGDHGRSSAMLGGHHISRGRSWEFISDTWAVMGGYHLKRRLSWAVIIEPVTGHGHSRFIP
jgi:hypothetical protein